MTSSTYLSITVSCVQAPRWRIPFLVVEVSARQRFFFAHTPFPPCLPACRLFRPPNERLFWVPGQRCACVCVRARVACVSLTVMSERHRSVPQRLCMPCQQGLLSCLTPLREFDLCVPTCQAVLHLSLLNVYQALSPVTRVSSLLPQHPLQSSSIQPTSCIFLHCLDKESFSLL